MNAQDPQHVQDPQSSPATSPSEGQPRPSSTSPPGGKTYQATKPPGQGDVDSEAVERGWNELDRAAGGH